LKEYSIHQYGELTLEILTPIVSTNKQGCSYDIADQRRNDAFPDVKTHSDPWGSVPDSHRDEEHVRHDMIQTE
jgi:hypothetical protein